MKIQGKTIKCLVSEEGMLLTQSGEVNPEDRIFSSKIYGDDTPNWVEWSQEEVDKFIEERKRASEGVEDIEPKEGGRVI